MAPSYPAVSILDPTYTYSVPAYQTAAGSADILSHILEGYFSVTEDSDISDGYAETVMRTVIRYLPHRLLPGHIDSGGPYGRQIISGARR